MKLLTILALVIGLAGCMSKDSLKKTLKENPDILTDAIKANPAAFITAIQSAAKDAQADMAKQREMEEQKKLESSYTNPLKPKIRDDESFRGNKNAPITLVEYSDFECPFCTRGFATVNELMKKYDGKIRFVYKHLPLSFHKNAMIASQYYEAIRLQSEKKAFEFHDLIFAEQRKLQKGEAFLKTLAKKVGANMSKLKKDVNSKKVLDRIKEDEAEAASFGMQGTPGFIINGIPVKGAYPASHFVSIIEELKKRGKLTL